MCIYLTFTYTILTNITSSKCNDKLFRLGAVTPKTTNKTCQLSLETKNVYMFTWSTSPLIMCWQLVMLRPIVDFRVFAACFTTIRELLLAITTATATRTPLNSLPKMSLGKVPWYGIATREFKQSLQVSMATLRGATTRHRHTIRSVEILTQTSKGLGGGGE